MMWRRRKPGWLIDPSNVVFGSVVESGRLNLSRSHVKVRYRHEAGARFVPLATFIRSCQDGLRSGKPLDIEQLIIAPIVKRRYAEFFDRLTDWEPATRRASSAPREPTQMLIADRFRSGPQPE